MKHIFIVHSNITYLISLAIIEYEKLDTNDIIILSNSLNSKYFPIAINKIKINKTSKLLHFLSKLNYPHYIDTVIKDLIQDDKFIVYMQSALPIQKIFMTHPNCCGFNFFEEGMANYHKFDTLNLFSVYNRHDSWRVKGIKDLRNFRSDIFEMARGYTGKIIKLPSWPNCYYNFEHIKYYRFSEYAFQGIPQEKKIKLDIKYISNYFSSNKDLPDLSNKLIWIGDNLTQFYKLNINSYINCIKKGYRAFDKKYSLAKDEIILKFHHAESEESRMKTVKIFRELGLKTVILPNDIPMEVLFCRAKNCFVLGITSSLLYYAKILDHNVFSFSNYIDGFDSYVNDDLNVFWEGICKV